jgi:hypothetical protein
MCLKHTCIAIATCATPDLLLKHLDATLETYNRRQIKHLKHASETLKKHLKNT